MVSLILAFVFASIFVMIISMAVSVRFVYREETVIIFDFLILQLELFPLRKRTKLRKSKKRKSDKGIKHRLREVQAKKKALDFLLRHSDVNINSIKVRAEESDPAKLTVYNGYIDSFICTALTYLRIKAQNLKNYNPHFSNSPLPDGENPTVDITLYTSFHIIAFSFITYLKDKNRKRERKIVGN